MPFQRLGLHPDLVRWVKSMNFETAMPIQREAIPLALEGHDIFGCAQTGSGKTVAFALPMIHKMLLNPQPGLRALILVPTRELAGQVESTFRSIARFAPIKTAVVIGGASMFNQKKAVSSGAQILVATPGRLLDHLRQKNFHLHKIDQLVLDEADHMLDMGFLPDIRTILGHIPRDRQTQFFSATLGPQVERVAAFATKNPRRVEIARPSSVAEGISQVLYPVIQSQKCELLLTLLKSTEMHSVLVFTRTKHGADKVAKRLKNEGYKSGVIHSNRSQNQRTAAMDSFRHKRIRILVATDIAARGIDVHNISHVVNFDVPRSPDDYIHRVGRTGRVYGVGDAITLMDPSEESMAKAIERFISIIFPRATVPNFQYNNPPRHGRPGGGKASQGGWRGRPGQGQGRAGRGHGQPGQGQGRPGQGQGRPGQGQGRAGQGQGRAGRGQGQPGQGRAGQGQGRPGQENWRSQRSHGRPGQGHGDPGQRHGQPGQGHGKSGQGHGDPGQGQGRPGHKPWQKKNKKDRWKPRKKFQR